MAGGANAPVIVKRKKVVGGGGHHGGAWKVAYADFVTAMMAFFMLMWLLNATTEQQRKGIADYFSPTIPINRVSGGGAGAFGGDNIFTEDALAQSGTGINQPTLGSEPVRGEAQEDEAAASEAAQVAALRDIEAVLLGQGGESMVSDQALRHVLTRLTDEGLVIELYDLPDAGLFETDSTNPLPVLEELVTIMAQLFEPVANDVAIRGHVRSKSLVRLDYPVWDLTAGRADQVRTMFEEAAFAPRRVVRLTGAGDRSPAVQDATAVRNNRLEIVLLRLPD